MVAATKNILYENRMVAFIDILGFKSLIKDSEQNLEKLNIIVSALSLLKASEERTTWNINLMEIEEDAQKKGLKKFEIHERTQVSCFSDSIVVSVKINGDDINHIASTLIANISSMGLKLMSEGILIRGAITLGKLIHTNNGILMGQALINAYELESSTAKYPRVILSNDLIKKLNYPLIAKKDRFPYHQYLDRFPDGCVGFHQMKVLQVTQNSTEIDFDEFTNFLDKIRFVILSGLDLSFEHTDIYQKYRWLKDQYHDLIIFEPFVKRNIPEPGVRHTIYHNHPY